MALLSRQNGHKWTSTREKVALLRSAKRPLFPISIGFRIATSSYLLELSLKLIRQKKQYNCKRWITRLAGRWRTELAPINGVNCRTRRTLDFRTHIAATGFPVALSVWGSVDLLTIMQVCSMRPPFRRLDSSSDIGLLESLLSCLLLSK